MTDKGLLVPQRFLPFSLGRCSFLRKTLLLELLARRFDDEGKQDSISCQQGQCDQAHFITVFQTLVG